MIPSLVIFRSLLNATFTIQRRDRVSDAQGGFPYTLETIGEVVGRMRPQSGTEEIIANAEGRLVSHVLYVEALENVRRGDEVVLGERRWEVLGVREPSLAGFHYEIDCEERQVEDAL